MHNGSGALAKKTPRNDARPPAGPAKKQARFEIRAEQDWLDRVERQAARLGLTAAAYVRQATTRQLELDEASEPQD